MSRRKIEQGATMSHARPGTKVSVPPYPTQAARWAARPVQLVALLATALMLALVSFSPASPGENENYKVAQGLGVYRGVLPAGMVRGPEAGTHGGAPRGAHEYHIIIAVFDLASDRSACRKRQNHLDRVGPRPRRAKRAETRTHGDRRTVTYGGFVNLPGNDRYQIGVEVRVPGRSAPVRVDFAYEISDTR